MLLHEVINGYPYLKDKVRHTYEPSRGAISYRVYDEAHWFLCLLGDLGGYKRLGLVVGMAQTLSDRHKYPIYIPYDPKTKSFNGKWVRDASEKSVHEFMNLHELLELVGVVAV